MRAHMQRWYRPVIKICTQSFVLPLALGLPLSANIFSDISTPELVSHHQSDKFTSYGSSSSGFYIRMGHSILFLEGIYGQDFHTIASQGFWGGLVPGLLFGLRPWATHAITHFTGEESKLPALAWYTLSALGTLPLLKSQLSNLSYILNASPFYSAPTLVAEAPYQFQSYKYHIQKYAKAPYLPLYYGLQLGGTMTGITLSLITQMLLGKPSEKLVTLTGYPGYYFFIKIQPGHFRNRNYTIEIQRIRLHATPSPDPSTPFGRLAVAMDRADTDILHIIPGISPSGNRLSLGFAKLMAATQAAPFKNNNTLQMDLNFEQVRPWLESSLVEGSRLFPGSLPAGSYFSVFQSTILNHIADAIICSQFPEQCHSGEISFENVNYQVHYTPHREIDIQPASIWFFHSPDNQTAKTSLGEGLTASIPSSKSTITLHSTYQHRPTVSHYWLPYSIGQALLAETNSAVRYAGLHLTQSTLTQTASKIGLPISAPRWSKPEFYDLSEVECTVCMDREHDYDKEECGDRGPFFNCGAKGKGRGLGCGAAMHQTCWRQYFRSEGYNPLCPTCKQKTSQSQIMIGPGQKN